MDAAPLTSHTTDISAPRPFPRSLTAGMGVFAAVLLVSFLGTYKTLGSHEVLAAAPAREMIRSGDWVVPRLGGQPRLKKPPLVYWQIALAAELLGSVTERTARIPQLCAGGLLIALLGTWTGRNYGLRAGWMTAFAAATSVWMLKYARESVVDMTLTLSIAACLLLVERQPDGQTWKQGFGRWTVIYALLGLSMLAKFYFGPVMVLVPCAVFWCVQRRFREFIHLLNPVGWVLLFGPLIGWLLLVQHRVPDAWAVWQAETVGRVAGEKGTTPLWNFASIPLRLSLPWVVFLLPVARSSWQRAWRGGDARERFLWIWMLSQLALILLQPNRHANYLLPIMPAIAILSGRQLAASLTLDGWLSYRWTRAQALALSVLSLAAGSIVAWQIAERWQWLRSAGFVAGGLLASGLVASIVLNRDGRPIAACHAMLAGVTGCYVCFAGWIVPQVEPWRAQAQLSRRARAAAGPVCIHCWRANYSPLFYLGSNVANHEHTLKLADELRQRGRIVLFARERDAPAFEILGHLEPLASLTRRERLIAGADVPYGCWELTVRDRKPRSPAHDSIKLPARIALPDTGKGVR